MWCPLPWIHQFITTNTVKTCCNGRVNGPAQPSEFANSDVLKDIKQTILEDKVHYNCTGCVTLEKQGYTSIRQEAIRDYPFYTAKTVPDKIEYLDLRYNNLCNFSCRTCEPAFSSSIAKEIAQQPVLKKYHQIADATNSFNSVSEDIFKSLPTIKKVNFTGGEPLLIKDNLKIMERLVELEKFNCEILITTNCSVYNHQWDSLLSKFKKVHWTLSVDGVDQYAEYIRYGTKWKEVDKNIQTIVQLGHSVAFNTTISAYSILNIDKLVKYYLEIEQLASGPIELWFHLCQHPDYLNPRVLNGVAAEKAKASITSAIQLLNNTSDKHRNSISLLENVYKNLNTIVSNTKFLEFTKDLDTVRNQNFQTLLKESWHVSDDKLTEQETINLEDDR